MAVFVNNFLFSFFFFVRNDLEVKFLLSLDFCYGQYASLEEATIFWSQIRIMHEFLVYISIHLFYFFVSPSVVCICWGWTILWYISSLLDLFLVFEWVTNCSGCLQFSFSCLTIYIFFFIAMFVHFCEMNCKFLKASMNELHLFGRRFDLKSSICSTSGGVD